MNGARIVAAGDAMLVAEFGDRIDPILNARALALADRLRRENVRGVRDVVPTFRSVAVYFDPLATDVGALHDLMGELAASATPGEVEGRPPVVVPVCYGGEFGPDLAEVARFAGLSEADVIARHSAVSYRVFMLGFMPGFAYLGTVDPLIAAPRRQVPRTRVVSGSVGIAGGQTGIYPRESPGGWQIVGRTPVTLFDGDRPQPCFLMAGDTVRFQPISAADFRLSRDTARSF